MTRPVLHQALSLLTKKERRKALVLMLLAMLGAFAEAIGIGAIFPFMTLLNEPAIITNNTRVHALYMWSGANNVNHFVLMAALLLLVLFFCKNLFLAMLYSLQASFVANLEARIANDLLAAYLRAPYLARLERNSADSIRIITGEVNRATAGFMMPAISLATEGLVVIAMVALLVLVNPIAAASALVLIGVVGGGMHLFVRPRLAAYREVRVKALSGMFKGVNEGIGSLKETKVLGREDFFISEFSAHSHAYARATGTFTSMNLIPRLIVEMAAVAALLLAIIVGITTGQAMHELVPLIALFGLAAMRIMPSATRILSATNTLRYYAPAVQTVEADMRLVGSLRNHTAARMQTSPVSRREPLTVLELERVSFCYPGSPAPSLREINLRISHGDVIAVAGKSGSGKTTLADLLLGLIDPLDGTIRVNGKAVISLSGEWRGASGLVPQEFFLRDNTVRRNVAFGLPDDAIDDQRVWRALQLARLEDTVRSMPQRLDMPVGERGALLSGGERQRLSIARALYEDPEILVLDEATSALDPATEAEFIATLQSLKGQKTIVVITHRVSSTSWCDRIVVMKAGRIAAEGTFADLAKHDPTFAELMGTDYQAAFGAAP